MSRNHAPWIGITADQAGPKDTSGAAKGEASLFLPRRYCHAVEQAGGVPLILPMVSSGAFLRALLDRLDGLIVSGGNFDIHPRFYGEKPIREIGAIKPERTEFELELTAAALRRDLPLLGICGGAQALNVSLGGSLYQDIATQLPGAGEHQQSQRKATGGHRVEIRAGTRLHRIVKRRSLEVNTTHHQAVKRPGRGLVVNATAAEGLIEGIESTRHSFALGVQWHPEVLALRYAHQRRIFASFITACRRQRRKR